MENNNNPAPSPQILETTVQTQKTVEKTVQSQPEQSMQQPKSTLLDKGKNLVKGFFKNKNVQSKIDADDNRGALQEIVKPSGRPHEPEIAVEPETEQQKIVREFKEAHPSPLFDTDYNELPPTKYGYSSIFASVEIEDLDKLGVDGVPSNQDSEEETIVSSISDLEHSVVHSLVSPKTKLLVDFPKTKDPGHVIVEIKIPLDTQVISSERYINITRKVRMAKKNAPLTEEELNYEASTIWRDRKSLAEYRNNPDAPYRLALLPDGVSIKQMKVRAITTEQDGQTATIPMDTDPVKAEQTIKVLKYYQELDNQRNHIENNLGDTLKYGDYRGYNMKAIYQDLLSTANHLRSVLDCREIQDEASNRIHNLITVMREHGITTSDFISKRTESERLDDIVEASKQKAEAQN